jgi:hypothetical protein
MQDFKNKLYNFEKTPPENLWEEISGNLNNAGPTEINQEPIKIPGIRGRSKFLYYAITAAASLIILFFITFFLRKDRNSESLAKNSSSKTQSPSAEKIRDSIQLNQQILERIIENPNKNLIASNLQKQNKYITIAGPEGQPVKISPKAATLIVSADNDYPPKPVWNKKIDKWKKIMQTSPTAPTATNLVDILELAANNETIE